MSEATPKTTPVKTAQAAEANTGTVAGTATPFPGVAGATVAPGTVEELTMANEVGKMVVIHR